MILLLAGTGDGRRLAEALHKAGIPVLASVVTAYGAELLNELQGIRVRKGPLDNEGLKSLVAASGVRGILDATHPFAAEATRQAQAAAEALKLPYLRWERPAAELPVSPLVHRVEGWDEAAQEIYLLGVEQVFLTVGVKPLERLVGHPSLARCTFTVRVLPLPESVMACRRLGLAANRIIAMQGPGSLKLNRALLEEYGAQALVTKESGEEGGISGKVQAALDLGVHVVVVGRPREAAAPAATSIEQVLEWAERVLGCSRMARHQSLPFPES